MDQAAEFNLNESMSVSLDGIRALAAQAMVVWHFISMFGVLPQLQPPFEPYMQNIGVVVFFVLSGYLIIYTVWRKRARGPYSFGAYAIERSARIFSGLLPCLAFTAIADGAVILLKPARYAYAGDYSLGSLLANVGMLQLRGPDATRSHGRRGRLQGCGRIPRERSVVLRNWARTGRGRRLDGLVAAARDLRWIGQPPVCHPRGAADVANRGGNGPVGVGCRAATK